MAIWAKNPYIWPPGGSKRGENEFLGKSENVMFLHSPRLSYMPKIRKIYRVVFRENLVRETKRQTDRETDRDGPEYKGPPDGIAKPSDQKNHNNRKWRKCTFCNFWGLRDHRRYGDMYYFQGVNEPLSAKKLWTPQKLQLSLNNSKYMHQI